ncbi:hypothetical protein F5883DRAFT_199934 [Diaporthe sp. PMI_573]|nr:hypothetical protein F5883DRAFT_199934 [Diaporthaceae sp. PMI_573]
MCSVTAPTLTPLLRGSRGFRKIWWVSVWAARAAAFAAMAPDYRREQHAGPGDLQDLCGPHRCGISRAQGNSRNLLVSSTCAVHSKHENSASERGNSQPRLLK